MTILYRVDARSVPDMGMFMRFIIETPRWSRPIAAAVLLTPFVAFFSAPPVFAADSGGIRWGAVGHNDWLNRGPTYSYNLVPLTRQMQLLTAAGLSWYRTACVAADCAELISAAKANGISILKSMALSPDDTLDEAANYARAYSFGVVEATEYNSAFSYFEASNELDNWVGMKGDGSSREQYNSQRYAQARGLIKGLIDGAHSVNPSAKVMVDDSGWCHYGFLQMLWADGVRWDVTAFHWYSNEGNMENAGCQGANVAAIHAAFGLPVWITEFNSQSAAISVDPAAAAAWLTTFMTQFESVASKYHLQAGFVYELLDEPFYSGSEAHYGIYDGNGNPKGQSQALAKLLAPPTLVIATPTPTRPNPPALLSVQASK